MKRSIDGMLSELYKLDKANNYSIRYMCGRWQVRNNTTYEGIDTDAGFNAAKKWMINNMKGN